MNDKNNNLISNVTVRLRRDDSSQTVIGTGLLYYKSSLGDNVYLLTASHALFEDGDSFQHQFKNICADIYNPEERVYKSISIDTINSKLLSKDKEEDVAVIVLDKGNVDAITHSLPTIHVIRDRSSFSLFNVKGFPYATRGKELASIQATWLQEMTGSKRFQLQLNADYTATNMEGFSGAGAFLEANNEVFLYGIFTRFREEEKGKVIYCQYIDSINKLLQKNFLPTIDYSYVGVNGLMPSFFSTQIEREVKNLGPRFNEIINHELPIARLFNSISRDYTFQKNTIAIIDEWLTERCYYRLKENSYLSEVENELEALREEIKGELLAFQKSSIETIHTLLPLIDKVRAFDVKTQKQWHDVYRLNLKEKKEHDKSLDYALSRLREIREFNFKLISEVEDLNLNLANHPTLIIQGEAGCGKSHLLGDIATQRKNKSLPTLLLLGTNFTHSSTIQKNILEKLDLSCSFSEFLRDLNNIGVQINSRVLILIDAINEGAGAELWRNQIAGFVNEVSNYSAIGLVLTVRNTYFDDIIPEDFKSNSSINITEHEGFKGSEYEALRLFCNHYNLKLPNIPILSAEFSNPLFLHIICSAFKDLPEKSFPKGFNGIQNIYELYKSNLEKRLVDKHREYKYQGIVTKVIRVLSDNLFRSKYHRLEISDAVRIFNDEFSGFPYLLSDLIEESFLIKMRDEYEARNYKDVVFFAYQRIGDFFMAEELLKPYSTKTEIKKAFTNNPDFQLIINDYKTSYNNGIIEAFSILLPEMYNPIENSPIY